MWLHQWDALQLSASFCRHAQPAVVKKQKQPKALRHATYLARTTLLEGHACSAHHTYAATSIAGRPSSTLHSSAHVLLTLPTACQQQSLLEASQAPNILHLCSCLADVLHVALLALCMMLSQEYPHCSAACKRGLQPLCNALPVVHLHLHLFRCCHNAKGSCPPLHRVSGWHTHLVLFIPQVSHALGLLNPWVPNNCVWEIGLLECDHPLLCPIHDLQQVASTHSGQQCR